MGPAGGAREPRRELSPPVDRSIEMVSTHDVRRTAADLPRADRTGTRIVELLGPCKYSPRDEAAGFTAALGRPVEAIAIGREGWEARFPVEGMRHPEECIAMLDGSTRAGSTSRLMAPSIVPAPSPTRRWCATSPNPVEPSDLAPVTSGTTFPTQRSLRRPPPRRHCPP